MKPIVIHFLTDFEDVAISPLFDSPAEANEWRQQNISNYTPTKIVSKELPPGEIDLKAVGYDPVKHISRGAL